MPRSLRLKPSLDWNVRTVHALPGHRLQVETVGGQKGIFDMTPFLNHGVFRELRDPHYFVQVGIVLGAVTWPHQQDIAPETLLAGLTAVTQETGSIG